MKANEELKNVLIMLLVQIIFSLVLFSPTPPPPHLPTTSSLEIKREKEKKRRKEKKKEQVLAWRENFPGYKECRHLLQDWWENQHDNNGVLSWWSSNQLRLPSQLQWDWPFAPNNYQSVSGWTDHQVLRKTMIRKLFFMLVKQKSKSLFLCNTGHFKNYSMNCFPGNLSCRVKYHRARQGKKKDSFLETWIWQTC